MWEQTMAWQDGVLALRQARAEGMSPGTWRHRLAVGRWQSPVPGIAIGHTGEPTTRQLRWVAVLHGGPAAVLSGEAALVERGFTGAHGRRIDVAVPASVRVGDLALGKVVVSYHRTKMFPGVRRERLGLPLYETDLAVLHAAAWARSDRDAEWRIAAVVQQRMTVPSVIRSRLADLPKLHRHALVVDVLDDVELGAHAGSELAFLRFCREHQLPLPDELQVRVRVGGLRYLDARYRRQRVTFELDGAHHREVRQWEADALRTLQLLADSEGERVVRLTMGLLRHDGDQVAALLRRLLA